MESHSQGEVLSLGGWELRSGRWLFVPVEFEVWAEYPFELRECRSEARTAFL